MYLLGVLGRPKGDCRLLSSFRLPNLPAFAWRAATDMPAEVFSMSKPSAYQWKWQRPFKDKPHDDGGGNGKDN